MTAFDRTIPALEPGPTRLLTKTAKIESARTGFKASIFLHVDYDPKDGNKINGIRLSEKGKSNSTLDRLLHAIGDEATIAVRSIQSAPPEPEGQR